MNKTIIHTCSSALVRPNGIVRYINYAIDAKPLCNQLFVTDSKPTQQISQRAELRYHFDVSPYTPNFVNGLPNLQIDRTVIETISRLIATATAKPWHKIVAHDLMSFMAVCAAVPQNRHCDVVFIQHESDVMNYPQRHSYLSDEWLQTQCQLIGETAAVIGVTVNKTNAVLDKAKNIKFMPVPFKIHSVEPQPTRHSIVYIGDGSDRKNAKEFIAVAEQLKLIPLIITQEPSPVFANYHTHTFKLEQQQQMYRLIAQSRVAYLPSKNECPGLVVLECLQFVPTVLNAAYEWTHCTKEFGAIVSNRPAEAITQCLQRDYIYKNTKLAAWCDRAAAIWRKL